MRAFVWHLESSKRWLFGLIGIIAIALTATTLGYFTMTSKVVLTVDGKPHTVRTFGDDVGSVLKGQGITLTSHDAVLPSVGSPIADGSQISVRFGRKLAVSVDGKQTTYWTTATQVDDALDQLGLRYAGAALSASRSSDIDRQGMALSITTPKKFTVILGSAQARKVTLPAATVKDALEQLDATYDANDIVKPGLTAPVKKGVRIKLIKVRAKRKQVSNEAVPFGTIKRPDSSMYFRRHQHRACRSRRSPKRHLSGVVPQRLLLQACRAQAAGAEQAQARHRAGRHQDRAQRVGLGPDRAV